MPGKTKQTKSDRKALGIRIIAIIFELSTNSNGNCFLLSVSVLAFEAQILILFHNKTVEND